jgi:hypothetical protein
MLTMNKFLDLLIQQYKYMVVFDYVMVNDPNLNLNLISSVVLIIIVRVVKVMNLVYLMMTVILVHQNLHDVLNDLIHDELKD